MIGFIVKVLIRCACVKQAKILSTLCLFQETEIGRIKLFLLDTSMRMMKIILIVMMTMATIVKHRFARVAKNSRHGTSKIERRFAVSATKNGSNSVETFYLFCVRKQQNFENQLYI